MHPNPLLPFTNIPLPAPSLAFLLLPLLTPIILLSLTHLLPYLLDPHHIRRQRIPGPFLARFSNFWLARASRSGRRWEAIHAAHEKYGSVVRIAPDQVSVVGRNAEEMDMVIGTVLGHGKGTLKSEFYDAFVSKHRGLFNTRDRAEHTRKRKIVSHTFAQRSVVEFEPYIRGVMMDFVKQWDRISESGTFLRFSSSQSSSSTHAEKSTDETIDLRALAQASHISWKEGWATLDILPWLNFLAFDIIGDLAFGSPFGMVNRGADLAAVELEDGRVEWLSAVEILNMRGEYSMTQGTIVGWMRPYMKYIDPWFGRGLNAVKHLHGIATNRVNRRLAEGAGDRKDLLSRLQEGRDDHGEPMGKDELIAEALTQLIAGSDTTSNSSCAILWWIVRHPRVHSRLLSLLATHLCSLPPSSIPEHIDLTVPSLSYLTACINEGLRLHSTSSIGLPRAMVHPATEVAGYVFPAGAVLSVPSYEVHRCKGVWGDPEVFRPERWVREEYETVEEGDREVRRLEKSFMPFSYGPRSCVGRNLAMMELHIIIATLIYNYDFELVDPDAKELPCAEGFLRKPSKCWMRIRKREIKV